jgi:hypothetical protein
MAWAGICHDGRTQLKIVQGTLNAVKYRDDVLDPIVLPFLPQRNFDHVFQHDVHTLVRETFPSPALHTITSIAKTK